MKYERPSKNAIGCMYLASGILDIIVFVIAMILWKYVLPQQMTWVKVIYYLVSGCCVFDLLLAPYIRYCRYRYCITDECIDVKEGFLFVERNIVPIERLHKIRTMRGPIDRLFGLTKVIVTTAGGDVTIRFLEEKQAEDIAMNLQRRVNQIIGKQREDDARNKKPQED